MYLLLVLFYTHCFQAVNPCHSVKISELHPADFHLLRKLTSFEINKYNDAKEYKPVKLFICHFITGTSRYQGPAKEPD